MQDHMTIGAQLYTVRAYTQTPEALSQTLRRLADMGWPVVQVSGTCPYEPAWLRDELRKNGLRCVITHTDQARIAAQPETVAAEHGVFDCRYIGLGSMPGAWDGDVREAYRRFLSVYKEIGARIHAAGAQLMYHNHDVEFAREADGRTIFTHMLDDFTIQELGFTLDTYWVQAGGGDPAWWLRQLRGRIPCVHLKDMAWDRGAKMAALGRGNLNFEAILAACEDGGTEYLLVEQDDCYGEDPFACLQQSYDFLRARGL